MTSIPEKIGNYKITAVIAKGGMGTVYKAIHPSLKRYVVIKKLTIRGNPALIERFKREAQIMMDLQHPNIVHMFDFFKEGSNYYIVIEFIDGLALDRLLKKRGKLSEPLAMLILRDTCRALRHAHQKGVIHRDIKPGNILLSKHGEIKLADFGIASSEKTRENEGSESLTQDGSALGTPSYMPPEQFSDSKTVDSRADIYALGVMLYEMVTGQKPFPGSFSSETLELINKGKYQNPKKLEPKLNWRVCSLIRKMIQPKAKNRIQDVKKIIKICDKYLEKYDLEQVRKLLVIEMIKDKTFKEPPFTKKKGSWPIYTSIAGVILLATGAFFLWHYGCIQATLLRKWYTPVSLNLMLPQSAKFQTDLPARALFFENDRKFIPEVKGSRRTFYSIKVKDDKGKKVASNNYKIRPVYLKHGSYRMKIVTGSYVWWQSLEVSSEAKDINLNFLAHERRNINIHTSSFEAATNKDLSKKTEFLFQNSKGVFVKAKDIPKEEFLNGRIWRIQVSCPGYKTEFLDLRIEWYQDDLYLNIALEKQK